MIYFAVVTALLLIGFFLFLKKRKPSQTNVAQPVVETTKSPEPNAVEVTKPLPVEKPQANVTETIKIAETPKPAPAIKTVKQPQNLPEDASLRRHYLTHLQAMAIAVHGSCPTDATLRRHYMAEIAAEVARCAEDKVALAHLQTAYEQTKKTVVVQTVTATVEKPVPVTATPVIEETPVVKTAEAKTTTGKCINGVKLPEDSTLKRHYLTQVYAQVAANLPPCPTDSTLRRHYQSLLENEVQKRLAA